MKTAIVTGATGFIGVHLCEELQRVGVKVFAVVRKNSPSISRLPFDIELIYCDMDSYVNLTIPPTDVFYHLAWEGATGKGRANPALQLTNAKRTVEALNAAVRNKCGKFIAIGTVYEKLLLQVTEYAGFRQADYYLFSKDYAHKMCDKISYQNNIEFIWALIFQPIGKYIKSEQMTAYVIASLIKNEMPILGEGLQPRYNRS
jgi:nucleoside-diphosphate-sugar epimerase